MHVKLGALTRGHRNRIREILDATAVFREEEVAVALELFDETFAGGPARAPYDPGDGVANYEFVGSFSREGQLVGYVCYGATPGTVTIQLRSNNVANTVTVRAGSNLRAALGTAV